MIKMIALLLIASAVCHAGWNIIAKGAKDKLTFLWCQIVFAAAVMTVPVLLFCPAPKPEGGAANSSAENFFIFTVYIPANIIRTDRNTGRVMFSVPTSAENRHTNTGALPLVSGYTTDISPIEYVFASRK